MNSIKRRNFFKKAARRKLFSDWLSQILAFVITGACFVGINQFGTSLSLMIYNITENKVVSDVFISAYLVFSLAFFVPLVYGLFCFEIKAIEGKSDLSELFCAFSGIDSLNRAYFLFFYTAVKMFFAYLPALVVWVFLTFYYHNGAFGFVLEAYGVDIVRIVLSVMLVVFFYFGFFVTSKFFTAIYVSIVRRDLPLRESFFVANNCVHIARGEIFSLALSFLPLFVVSIFTVGFLFVMYTLPYMLLTFVMFSKYLYDVEMSDKTTSHLMYIDSDNQEE